MMKRIAWELHSVADFVYECRFLGTMRVMLSNWIDRIAMKLHSY